MQVAAPRFEVWEALSLARSAFPDYFQSHLHSNQEVKASLRPQEETT
jgi:hypothetical protein